MKFNIDVNNEYTKTQQNKYNELADLDANGSGWRPGEPKGFVVAILEAHNGWADYEQFLWKDIPDLKSKDVLDFGCGPGRNLIHYHDTFKSIDGVDLAIRNLDTAKTWIRTNGLNPDKFKLYKSNGISLNTIPDASYDVVMSTICMQHISVYEIRYNLLAEFYRVLRPGGYITLQMLYTADKPGVVKYYDNHYTATSTNGSNDCTVENAEFVQSDLEEIGFVNFHHYIRPSAELMGGKRGPDSDKDWIYVNAQKPIEA